MTIIRARTLPRRPSSGCRRAGRPQSPSPPVRGPTRGDAGGQSSSWLYCASSLSSSPSSASVSSRRAWGVRTLTIHSPPPLPSANRGPRRARDRSPPPGPRASRRRGGSPSRPRSTAPGRSRPLRAPPCTCSSKTPTMPATRPPPRPSTSHPRSRASCGARRALFPSPSGAPTSYPSRISSSSVASSSTRRRAPSPWPHGRGRRRSLSLTASSWRAMANRRARAGRRSPPRGYASGRQPRPAKREACAGRPCSPIQILP